MGSITSGTGLISGIDTAQLIEDLLALKARPKIRLQQRITNLEAQKTGILDINSRLLNLQNTAKSFRLDNVFDSVLATSTDEDVLTATTSSGAQPGNFNFIVKQTVSTSQQITSGFNDKDSTPLGLSEMSFEFGNGVLSVDRSLEDLNGGNGVDRGKITITDRSGAQATVDLTDVTTVEEVLDRINSATDINVSASVTGDGLTLTDNTGQTASNLIVANLGSDTTATDLGIEGNSGGTNTINGSDVFTLGGATTLNSLNDGNGVLIRKNVPDLRITAQDGTLFEIDLGRKDAPITEDTELADLNNGNGVTMTDGDTDFQIITSTGEVVDINIGAIINDNDQIEEQAVESVGELLDRVNTQLQDQLGNSDVTLSINGEQTGFTLTDTLGGANDLEVVGAGANGDDTAEDLGILGSDPSGTIQGDVIPNVVDTPAASTIQQVIDRINEAMDSAENPNGGRIVASIAPDGNSIQIEDTTGGGGDLEILGAPGSGTDGDNAAKALGIFTEAGDVAGNIVNGQRIIGGLDSVLLSNLNGGGGLNGASQITVNDRAGNSFTFDTGPNTFQDNYDTVDELIDALNAEAQSNNVDVEFSLNEPGNGIQATDTSGGAGNLTISGDAADALGIAVDDTVNSVKGDNLQLRYVSEAVKLDDLNYGRGIGTGSFQITDGLGESATVSIGSDSETLFDVIQEINSKGLAINARINDNGDGITIEEDTGSDSPFVPIKITAVDGSTAKDLNILGESETVDNASIEGSYEQTISFDEGDTLQDVVGEINNAGAPVSASIVNTGSGANPFRINFTSQITGKDGELIVDSGNVDLGLNVVEKGSDAKVFFGASTPEDGMLITSNTNTFDEIITGVSVDVQKASDDPVTLSVQRDDDAIVSKVEQFVANFNDAIQTINKFDFFDTETEERGVLLGDGTTALARTTLYNTLRTTPENVDGQFQLLSQVGITVGDEGLAQFDEDKFREALQTNRQDLEALFAAFESTEAGPEEIAPGVTVSDGDQVVTVRGIGELFNLRLGNLTDSIDGAFPRAEDKFDDQIELLEDRIDVIDERIASERERLERQFLAMEEAIAQIQSQFSALQSIGVGGGGGGLIGA